ncbi:hypothetical protein IW262DRAFT_1415564 [Armillaria fumosa]|nr:hypothetical protein IW262DRAFT_1415564 [Armillaria fumosa]
MLSLIRVAALVGILAVSVECAVVLDGRQLGETGPVAHTCACIPFIPIISATDNHPLPTDSTWAPVGTIVVPVIGHPTKRAKVFSPPLFAPVSIDTSSVESPSVGGSCTIVEADSTSGVGSTFTPGASAFPVQLVKPIFTEPVPSHEVTLEGASATPTASTDPAANTHAVGPSD